MAYLVIKNIMDYILDIMDHILAVLGMIILSPLFLLLIIAIKLDSKGPVLFQQKRVGIHKSHFNIQKIKV